MLKRFEPQVSNRPAYGDKGHRLIDCGANFACWLTSQKADISEESNENERTKNAKTVALAPPGLIRKRSRRRKRSDDGRERCVSYGIADKR